MPRPGDDLKIIFTSGEIVEGRFIEFDGERYRISIGGLEVRVAPSDVRDVIVLPTLRERFDQMRALIEADDTDSMLALSNWAEERGLLPESLGVVEEALVFEPNNAELKSRRDLLRAQVALELTAARRRATSEADPELDPEPDRPVDRPKPYPNFPLLSDEQVNLIKVYEIDLKRPPHLVIERETIDMLLQDYAGHPLVPSTRDAREILRRRSPAQVLDLMFRVQARELYPEVRVVGHPQSMRLFRDQVHAGWLINSCATNRCHGGDDARGLILYNRRPTSSRSVYTNLLILERARTGDGQLLIDYQNPERSPLLQMTLPRDDAITPHPDVLGWKPVFLSRDSRGFQRAVRWMNAMYKPRPEHPIDYVGPGEEAEEAPGSALEQPVR